MRIKYNRKIENRKQKIENKFYNFMAPKVPQIDGRNGADKAYLVL